MSDTKPTNQFWTSVAKYPNFPHRGTRLGFDLNFIQDLIPHTASVLDVGCGDASHLKALYHLEHTGALYGTDLDSPLFRSVSQEHKDKIVFLPIEEEWPTTDLAYTFGTIIYMEKDTEVKSFLNRFTSEHLLLKAPCYDVIPVTIDKWSEELGCNYRAVYRSVAQVIDLLPYEKYDLRSARRAYVDSIESSYGSKQWVFHLTKKKD